MDTKLVIVAVAISIIAMATCDLGFQCKTGDINCMKRWHDSFFETLSRNQTWLEVNFKQNPCNYKYNTNAIFREVAEPGRYKLTTKLNGFSEDGFEIKIRSNLLYLIAINEQVYNFGMAILPQFVDAAKASYFYEDNELSIVFPVKTAIDTCYRGFKNVVTNVPKFEDVWGSSTTGAQTGFQSRINLPSSQENRANYFRFKKWYDDIFFTLSNMNTWLEYNLEQACVSTSNGGFREIIEVGQYKLTTRLSGYAQNAFDIKIKSSILYSSASNQYAFNADVAVLPGFVDVFKAYYIYNGGTLDIVFPIKNETDVCARSFQNVHLTVPQRNFAEPLRPTVPVTQTPRLISGGNAFSTRRTPAWVNPAIPVTQTPKPIVMETPTRRTPIGTNNLYTNEGSAIVTMRPVVPVNREPSPIGGRSPTVTRKTPTGIEYPLANGGTIRVSTGLTNPFGNGAFAAKDFIKEWHDQFFNTLNNYQTWLENSMSVACQYSQVNFTEEIKPRMYKLITQLPISVADVDIKISGYVLYFSAKNNGTTISALRILPRFINADRASYAMRLRKYDTQSLIILIPIINNTTASCVREFKNQVVTVVNRDRKSKPTQKLPTETKTYI